MRIFGWEIGRREKAAGTTVSVPLARGVSYYLGPIMEAFGGAWSRHIVADSNENLLQFSAVYACIDRISSDISILRPKVMQEQGGICVEVKDKRVPFVQLMARPNAYMTWVQFLAYWMVCKLTYGNAYVLKDRDDRGVVRALYPIDPRLAKPMVSDDGSVWYQFSGDNLARIPGGEPMLPASEVIHDRMCCIWHPLVGTSPLYANGVSATQGIRIQANSAKFFENMSRPSGHLSFTGTVGEEQLKLLKQQFEQGFSAGNIGRLLVTGGDAKYAPMTIPAEAAQLIEQLKWTVEDVARCFHVPLHKLQAGPAPTFSNIGALNQGYYDDCLKVHLEAMEALLTYELGAASAGYSIEFDLEGLLRMDPKSRAETREIDMRAGTLTINEGRAQENRPPVEGGDTTYLQQQNFSLEALAKRDAQPDPFGTAKPEPAAPADPSDDEEDDAAAEEAAAEARALLETIQKGFEHETV